MVQAAKTSRMTDRTPRPAEATGPLQFDRRRELRRDVAGSALAVFTDSNGPGKLARVTLIDSSQGGLGVRTQCAVEPGACFSLVPECGTWPRQVGIVVRCDKTATGYSLGLRSRVIRAAA